MTASTIQRTEFDANDSFKPSLLRYREHRWELPKKLLALRSVARADRHHLLALFQPKRQLDVIDPAVRARHKTVNAGVPDAKESQRRADEAMRLLEASTPEM